MEKLKVEVEGTRITVSIPDTRFWVTYQKKFGNQSLVVIASWLEPNLSTPEVVAFRIRAKQAANANATTANRQPRRNCLPGNTVRSSRAGGASVSAC